MLTTLLIPKTNCPECGKWAQVVRDTSSEIYDEIGVPVLECLQKDCLHWEYLDNEEYLELKKESL